MALRKENGEAVLDSSEREYEAVCGSSERATEASASIKLGKFYNKTSINNIRIFGSLLSLVLSVKTASFIIHTVNFYFEKRKPM